MINFLLKVAEFAAGGMLLGAIASLLYNIKQVSEMVHSRTANRHYTVTVSDYAGHRVERETEPVNVGSVAQEAARELERSGV